MAISYLSEDAEPETPTNPQADAAGSDGPPREQVEANIVARWQERIQLSNRIFSAWEKRFLCRQGWEWYEGYQGRDAYANNDPEIDRAIVNVIHSTVRVKIPSLYYSQPKATIVPRAPREDDMLTMVGERAKLLEDTVNSVALDPDIHLQEHTLLALKESFFYFGVVEVGYDADWVSNPNAGKPILEGDRGGRFDHERVEDADWTPDAMGPTQPAELPAAEGIYVKRIPAGDFRVSARSHFLLSQCDWAGYREWVYVSDLKKNPLVEMLAKRELKATGGYSTDYTGRIDSDIPAIDGYFQTEEAPSKAGMVLIWKIWDFRTKTRFIVPNEGHYFVMRPKPFSVQPFSVLKFDDRKEGCLPIPQVFDWMSPQAQLNYTREMERVHQARMVRRYQSQKGAVDQNELDKLESGGDGTIVQTNTPVPAIIPIEDAPLDFAVTRNVQQSQQDFANVSNTGEAQRQAASGGTDTATEVTVVETRARLRESFEQSVVAKWLGDIMGKILLTIKDHMVMPFWIQRNVDPLSPAALIEAGRIAELYQQITSEDLGPLNYDVVVVAENLSPINEDVERQKFSECLTVITANPMLMLLLVASEGLLRKFLGLYGIRNEKLIQEIKTALSMVLMAQAAGGGQGAGAEGEGASGEGGEAGNGAGPSSGADNANLPGMSGSTNQVGQQMGMSH